jgi:radical SAM superfamily enzyme YgiQ (UPF0313 family)
MIDTGCEEVAIGVESGAQSVLDMCNKRTTVEDNVRALDICAEFGLPVRAYILLGLPGENEETVAATRRFMEEAPAAKFTISVFCPYPGTDIWNNPDKYGVTIEDFDWSHYYGIGDSLAPKSMLKEMQPLASLFEEVASQFVGKSTFGINKSHSGDE